MTPSKSSAAVAATNNDRNIDGIRFKEKRLDIRIWRCEEDHQKGSHFPICVFRRTIRKVAISRSVSSRTMSAADRQRSWRSASNIHAEIMARSAVVDPRRMQGSHARCRPAARSAVATERRYPRSRAGLDLSRGRSAENGVPKRRMGRSRRKLSRQI